MTKELETWLALIRIPGLGPVRFCKLLEYFPKLTDLFPLDKKLLLHYGFSEQFIRLLEKPAWKDAEKDLLWAMQKDCHIIALNQDDYPQLLRQISSPPPLLFVKGQLNVLGLPQLAVVGSRNPTPLGLELAHQFAAYFSEEGFVITSGLALGIDASSHRGALSKTGKTIAVMGTGPDSVYPARHQNLAASITENGAIVTEYPVGVKVRAENFPQRNRIISGLSVGVLVVEAAPNSGSLITARIAAEQGREVFAVPGSVYNPLARGCHALLKQGAKLVETAQDVLEELSGVLPLFRKQDTTPKEIHNTSATVEPEYAQLISCVDYAPTPVDVIVARSGLTVEEVSSMLLILELNGNIAMAPGGYVRK